MKMLVLVLASLALFACGSGGPDPDFSGLWVGPTTLSGPGGSFSYVGSLSVEVEEDALVVTGFCPSGGGALRAAGEDSEVEFSGTDLSCPAPTQDCPTEELVYTSGSLRVANDTLFANARARLLGCGRVVGVTATFTGARQ